MSRLSDTDRERIAALFDRHLEAGLHHGAQLAVYVDGEPVIDLAGGVEAPDGPDETRETRHILFSSTKPYAAVTLHSLVEEGELDYDDRVVDHWPEFADEGTERPRSPSDRYSATPRDSIEARSMIGLTSGVTGMPWWSTSRRWSRTSRRGRRRPITR